MKLVGIALSCHMFSRYLLSLKLGSYLRSMKQGQGLCLFVCFGKQMENEHVFQPNHRHSIREEKIYVCVLLLMKYFKCAIYRKTIWIGQNTYIGYRFQVGINLCHPVVQETRRATLFCGSWESGPLCGQTREWMCVSIRLTSSMLMAAFLNTATIRKVAMLSKVA